MQARRRKPYLEIVALEKGDWTSYSACGIPYLVGGDVASLDDLVARSPEEFRDKHRIDVRLHHEAMGIDAARSHGGGSRPRAAAQPHDLLRPAPRRHGSPSHPPRPAGDRPRPREGRPDARRRQGAARPRPHLPLPVGRGGRRRLHRPGDGRGVRPLGGRGHPRRGLRPADGHARRRHGRAPAPPPARPRRSTCGWSTPVAGFEPGKVLLPDGGRAGRRPRGARPGRHAQQRAGRRRRRRARAPAARSVVDRRQRTTLDGVYAAGDCCESHHLVSGPAGPRRARHRRQQAGSRGGHQPRWRVRHLPGGASARRSPRCAPSRWRAPASPNGRRRRRASRPSPPPSTPPPSPGTCPTPSRWR